MADEPTNLITLRPLAEADAAVAYNWWRDQEVQELSSASVFTGTPEEFDSFFHQICVAEDPQRLTAGIVDRQSGRLIGLLVLRLSADGAEGEFGIKIGEKDYWGHGYGREATRFFLRQVFATTAVEMVYGLVDITNQRASQSGAGGLPLRRAHAGERLPVRAPGNLARGAAPPPGGRGAASEAGAAPAAHPSGGRGPAAR